MSPRAKVQAGGILRTSIDTTWRTPEYIFECVRAYFGGAIPFDPATGPDNPAKALRFLSEGGLEQDWGDPGRAWVNPPFAKAWYEKIDREAAQGVELVVLLPCNRFETDFFQSMFSRAECVCFHRRRIKFISSIDGKPVGGNPYASMILGFNVNPARFAEAFAPLGLCMDMGEAS